MTTRHTPAWLLIPLLLIVAVASAKDRRWQDATVLKLTTDEAGTQSIVLPLGNGAYGASSTVKRSFYWIKTDKITYVIHNYSNGAMVERWLLLTIGGPTTIAVDGKNVHVLDDEGKDRTCRIVMKIANPSTEPNDKSSSK
jgi:hypothetical protein